MESQLNESKMSKREIYNREVLRCPYCFDEVYPEENMKLFNGKCKLDEPIPIYRFYCDKHKFVGYGLNIHRFYVDVMDAAEDWNNAVCNLLEINNVLLKYSFGYSLTIPSIKTLLKDTDKYGYILDELPFHNNFNMLMETVNKIVNTLIIVNSSRILPSVVISKNVVKITNLGTDPDILRERVGGDSDTSVKNYLLVLACHEFIKKYVKEN